MAKKKRQFPTSIVFMAVVAVFVAWTYFVQYKGKAEKQEVETSAQALVPFSNSAILGVHLKWQKEKTGSGSAGNAKPIELVLRREGSTWNVDVPYKDLVDEMALDSFLSSLSTEKAKETVVEGEAIDWKTYGLESPLAEVKFNTDSQTRTIEVGTIKAFDGSMYGRIDGAQKVVLLSSALETVLTKDPKEFRDKRFFPAAHHPEFVGLEIKNGSERVSLEKQDGDWLIAGSKKGTGANAWPLDSAAINSFVGTVTGLRGNEIWGDDKSEPLVIKARKLDRPELTIRLVPKQAKELAPSSRGSDAGTEPYELKVSPLEKDQSLAAGVGSMRPVILGVYKAQIETMSKKLDAFRDMKFPFQFQINDITRIELERGRGGTPLPLLVKVKDQWAVDPRDSHFSKEPTAVVNSDQVVRLMTQINELVAKKVLAKGASRPNLKDKSTWRLALIGDSPEKRLELTFSIPEDGKSNPNGTSSRVGDRVFEFDKSKIEALPIDEIVRTVPKTSPSPSPAPGPAAAMPALAPKVAR